MLLASVLIALAWVALTGEISAGAFFEGLALGIIVLLLVSGRRASRLYAMRALRLVTFIGYFVRELVKSNLRVTYDVLTPTHHMRPGIVAVPLDAETDLEIMLLANLITLTPGTLSLDVSADRRVLFVHTMYLDDVESFRIQIKHGIERRLLEVMR